MNLGISSIYQRVGWRIVLLLLLGGLVPAACCGAENKKAQAETEGLLRDRGFSAAVASKVARALVKAEEQDSITPLLPLLEDKEMPVACAAAFMAIAGDPDAAVPRVMKMLRQNRGSATALLLALSMSNRRDTAKFLIDELTSKRSADREEAALFSLRVMTGQSFGQAAEWSEWWRAHGMKEKLAFPKGDEELQRRVFAAAALLRSSTLRAAIAKSPDTPGESARKTDMLEDFAALLEKGARMRLSTAALAGDEAFSRGQIEGAAKAYAQAIKKDPGDQRSAYLRACALFELGRRDEAGAAFAAIEANDPKAVAALFLAQLSKLPGGTPLLPAARATLEKTILFRGGTYGWDDPILATLRAQQLAGNGPRIVPQDSLDEIVQDSPDDLELRCGVAQCRPRMLVGQAFAALRERFPKSALPLCGWLSASRGGAKADSAALVAAASRWRELEPGNAVPALLVLGLQQPRDAKRAGLQPYDDVTASAVAAATLLPEFEDRGRELCLATRRVSMQLKFPFALEQLSHRPSFEEELFDVLSRLSDTELARFAAGDTAEAQRLGEAVDTLAARLVRLGGTEGAQTVFRSAAVFSLSRHRQRLVATGADGETLTRLENHILESKDWEDAETKGSAARQSTLQLLALPSLEREIAEEQLAVPPTDTPGL